MKRHYKLSVFSLLILLVLGSSCTKLNENVYSEITSDNYYNNPNEVLSAVLRPYTHAGAWAAPTGQQSAYRLNELSGDQLAWPVKGVHGYDNGDWIRQHYHTWNSLEDNIWNPWSLMFTGIGYCNDPITNLMAYDLGRMGITAVQRDQYVAELKVFRAWHYLKLMDLYGNIPVVTQVGTPLSPPTESRAQVFAFIESELKANVDLLPKLSQQSVGRITQAAGYAMLAELYLNAEVWTGTAKWDECTAACDKILTGQTGGQNGAATLDPNLTVTFSNTNTTSSTENLFVLAYNYQLTTTRIGWNSDFFHFNQKYIYGGDANGNDGVVVIPSAYDAFADNDLRKSTWMLIGPQYYFTDPKKPVTGSYEYKDQPLVFVDNIQRNSEGSTVSSMTTGEENSGARFNKYRSGPSTDANYWSNDWVIYRLTDIYFYKAEALMRKNGGTATGDAVTLINTCRKRAFADADWQAAAYTTGSLTMDELLAERGREFIFEGKRRTDLIRFGKFVTAAWWDHTPSNNKNLNVYPIPNRQLTANKNLVQNPGY
ncbi:RagB/SusD family nutrient uptake outer membrane protein [Pedobacter sp. L105]|uniref:RagB/SusD family nutrient uptake outer membrane protein n=1 Tax=Pedobacter sp. L105 TaxID=1641871 RepID=UPI00131D74D4|nr:RagB/SusD family nutrient uptake outer membrane protein [Pedobacter sp. L105]